MCVPSALNVYEARDGRHEQTQPRQYLDVRHDVGRVESLPSGLQTCGFDEPRSQALEQADALVVTDEVHPVVVQGLLAKVGVLGSDVERILPRSTPLQLLQRLLIRQIKDLFEDEHAEHQPDRLVGALSAWKYRWAPRR